MTLSTDGGVSLHACLSVHLRSAKTQTMFGLITRKRRGSMKMIDEMRDDPEPMWLKVSAIVIGFLFVFTLVML
jgi:hypothetical protein